MKYLKNLVVFMMFMFFPYYSFGQSKKPSDEAIMVESKIRLYCFQEVEYASLKISYKNISKDTIYLWTQNWRVHYLNEQDSTKFKNCPYDINGGFLNAVTFYKKNRVTKFFERSSIWNNLNYGDTIVNCNFVKKINPEETFHTNIIFSDSSFIAYLKKDKPDNILLHYSFAINFKFNLEVHNNFYYKDDELIINYEKNPDSVNCITNNVVSRNGIQEKFHRDKFYDIFNPKRIILNLNW